jgi:nitric oxide reductase subunit B
VLAPEARWDERWLRIAFWALNGGLAAMALLSLLPLGVLQTAASIEHGTWYARSAELRQGAGGAIEALRWLRVPGDVLFTAGAVAIALFFMGRGRRARRGGSDS